MVCPPFRRKQEGDPLSSSAPWAFFFFILGTLALCVPYAERSLNSRQTKNNHKRRKETGTPRIVSSVQYHQHAPNGCVPFHRFDFSLCPALSLSTSKGCDDVDVSVVVMTCAYAIVSSYRNEWYDGCDLTMQRGVEPPVQCPSWKKYICSRYVGL